MPVSISLGPQTRVEQLFSFPNSPDLKWTLADTVKHWFDMTLERDGLAALGAQCKVTVSSSNSVITLTGPAPIQTQLQEYNSRLPQFLSNGWDALTNVVPKIKAAGRWDPHPEPPPYHPWRFFLPLGMAMLNQKAVLFFHYPPIRLLETNQDYLDDPVPVRCEELLTANGVAATDLPLFNTVMDATPIGAEDDQGSLKVPGMDKTWGLIPIQDFHDYQRAQVNLLLNTHPQNDAAAKYTVPIVVYGAHPLATFNELYQAKFVAPFTGTLKNGGVTVAEILPGKLTPVMASTHPYVFYGTAQGFDKIGSGKLVNPQGATSQMIKDLGVARWLKLMSDDPSQNPKTVLASCQKYWQDTAQAPTVNDLVQHQGSLFYSDPQTLKFQFLKPLSGAVATRPAAKAVSSTPAPLQAAAMPKASSAPKASSTATKSTAKSNSSLSVIGDSGKPVDWWFIYKVSKESESATVSPVTGAEYVYFDSEMAQNPKSQLVLSKNRIDQSPCPLFDTLSPLFSPEAKANKSLGWYCYNDEDHEEPKRNKDGSPKMGADGKPEMSGSGPEDRGHCKGVLAFDLNTNSAFWLIHSVPLFPLTAQCDYPSTGYTEAQTMLCIQLADADTAKSIAHLMYVAHGPNVNVASDLLKKAALPANQFQPPFPKTNVPTLLPADDPRIMLMQDCNASTTRPTPYPPGQRGDDVFLNPPYPGRVPFKSRGGQAFIAIGKNRVWGEDFYNDLVSVVLAENLEVETWEDTTKIPPPLEKDKSGNPIQKEHDVEAMKSVDLTKLRIPFSWSESNDHAKLAISDRQNAPDLPRWVCVGDINFTDAQEKRGGGTVAFQCLPLWTSLAAILTETPESPKQGTTQKKTPTKAKASAAAKKATVPLAKQAIPKTATASPKAKSAQGKSGSAPAQKSTKTVVSKKAVAKSKRK